MRTAPETNEHSLFDITERERLLISEELHEGLCQHLAAASLAVGLLIRRSENGQPLGRADLAELGTLVQRASGEGRSFTHQLKPIPPEAEGLMKALDKLAAFATKSIPCEFICEKLIYVRDPHQALVLYRICQEAIRNALKHSHAHQITISLLEESARISVQIRDNGRGFSIKPTNSQLRGLEFMHYLANIIGADLTIDSRCNPGTMVTCVLLQ